MEKEKEKKDFWDLFNEVDASYREVMEIILAMFPFFLDLSNELYRKLKLIGIGEDVKDVDQELISDRFWVKLEDMIREKINVSDEDATEVMQYIIGWFVGGECEYEELRKEM